MTNNDMFRYNVRFWSNKELTLREVRFLAGKETFFDKIISKIRRLFR